MPLQATSGAASYDAFGGGVAAVPNYIEDVFSTWLYTGNGNATTRTISNGLDFSSKGGAAFIKNRSAVGDCVVTDTVRGARNPIFTSQTARQDTNVDYAVNSFLSNGFTLATTDSLLNTNGSNYVAWSFLEQPKFFDVVTYTGNGSDPQTISHNLGSVPGCMIVKRTDSATNGSWYVYHRSLTTPSATATNNYLILNTTAASVQDNGYWGFGSSITATTFEVNNQSNINGATYVAYLFAHNAGGFGLTGTDNVISCGSFTGNGSTSGPEINLGYEPQWIMIKNASAVTNWRMFDNMRGMPVPTSGGASGNSLEANTSAAEAANDPAPIPTATGFRLATTNSNLNGNGNTMIYIAIRRGPMRTPTTGTSVFTPVFASSSGTYTATAGFPVDLNFYGNKSNTDKWFWFDRLRGNPFLQSNTAGAESASTGKFDSNTAFSLTATGNFSSFINYAFRRAPGFFDEVCYTGTGSARTVTHNLTVVPELMIVKSRSSGTLDWLVYSAPTGNANALLLNTTDASFGSTSWGSTTPTASVFSTGASGGTNNSGATFVAYLFASCPGVSKVGSYTGNGNTAAQGGQTINCGFTGSARFILIKCTSSAENWYVWDSARGIVPGNDPSLTLNTTEAENAGYDAVDAVAGGFIVNNNNASNLNTSGQSYIFLAIA